MSSSPKRPLSTSSKRSSTRSDRNSNVEELREAMATVSLNRSTLSSNASASTPLPPVSDHGSVILAQGTEFEYYTRYRINHADGRKGINKDVILEECVPCCTEEAKENAKRFCKAFVQSEGFLFSLHVTALVLGVIKETMNIREISEDIDRGAGSRFERRGQLL